MTGNSRPGNIDAGRRGTSIAPLTTWQINKQEEDELQAQLDVLRLEHNRRQRAYQLEVAQGKHQPTAKQIRQSQKAKARRETRRWWHQRLIAFEKNERAYGNVVAYLFGAAGVALGLYLPEGLAWAARILSGLGLS